ncbi:MAG: hydantoinase B/oxoprolinase family protein, partial [Gammaproteobacteria bacterium]
MDNIERTLFVNRIQAICKEMGAVLQHTAFSPNIRDRLDFSCAIFDAAGQLCAQAAHIPVHLGSMAYAMHEIVKQIPWQDGDTIILNDPFMGGTHLPDVTLISPVFFGGRLCAYVANRAHHADIGARTPGSMPLTRRLEDEGFVIPPTYLVKQHGPLEKDITRLLQRLHAPENAHADLSAQLSSNNRGVDRLQQLIKKMKVDAFQASLLELNSYAEKLARTGIQSLPDGHYTFEDFMDDDGLGNIDIPIQVTLHISDQRITVDFSGTAGQASGNINCPISVTAAAVYYCFYCLMPKETPVCAGSFRPIRMIAPEGCLVNARRPAAVAAGNVETSTRLVDVVLGALALAIPDRIPAASHGSMNNIAMGTEQWDYYETLGGGMGAGPAANGVSAIHTHMTNTLNTPIEVLERHYPLRIKRYQVRRGSGGQG